MSRPALVPSFTTMVSVPRVSLPVGIGSDTGAMWSAALDRRGIDLKFSSEIWPLLSTPIEMTWRGPFGPSWTAASTVFLAPY